MVEEAKINKGGVCEEWPKWGRAVKGWGRATYKRRVLGKVAPTSVYVSRKVCIVI